MNKIDSLFLLIKSLNASEKRHIKLNMGRKNAQYLKLWNVLEKLKTYKSEEVRAKLGENMVSKHLAFHKNYLFNLILKHLSFSESDAHSDTDIQRLTIYSDILMRKNLIPEAMGMLERARALCYRSEKPFFLPEILLRKMYILELNGKPQDAALHKVLSDEYVEILNTLRYETLFHAIRFEANSRDRLPEKEAREFLHQLEKLPTETLAGYSLKQYYFLSILCLKVLGNYKKAMELADQLIDQIKAPTGLNQEKKGRELLLALYDKVKLSVHLDSEAKLGECLDALIGYHTTEEREEFLQKRLLLLLFPAWLVLGKNRPFKQFEGFSLTGSWSGLISRMSPRENQEIMDFSLAIFYKRKDFGRLLKVISFCESNESNFVHQPFMRARFRLMEGVALLHQGETEVVLSRIGSFLKIPQFGTLPSEIRSLVKEIGNAGKMDPIQAQPWMNRLYERVLPYAVLP
jgi:hypothetical protein